MLLRDPYDVIACVSLFGGGLPPFPRDGFGGADGFDEGGRGRAAGKGAGGASDWPDDDLIILVDREGYATRMLQRPADSERDLASLVPVLAEVVDEWDVVAVIGVMRRSSSPSKLARKETRQWVQFARAIKAAGLSLLDVVFLDPLGWGSVRWTDEEPPVYVTYPT